MLAVDADAHPHSVQGALDTAGRKLEQSKRNATWIMDDRLSGVKFLFHFTDECNFPPIRQLGCLWSTAQRRKAAAISRRWKPAQVRRGFDV
jgi:hypothetical protein